MNQFPKNHFASYILSALIFCHRIHVHAQIQPPDDIPAHAQYATTTFGWVLKRHVIKTLSNLVGIGQCFMQCSFTDYCYSLNFYPHVSVCELNSATNASHPRDFVPSDIGSYLLYISRPATICDDLLFCAGDQVCLLEKDGVTRQCKACASPLGMEDGSIPDSALSASSSNMDPANPNAQAKYGRLNSNTEIPCWAPVNNLAGHYLQVDLGQVKVVSKVATQGRRGDQVKYVTKYTIKWSMDGQTWEDHKENDVVKVFNGNFDQHTAVTNSFQPKITARHIRLVVQEWFDFIAVRMELYGCSL